MQLFTQIFGVLAIVALLIAALLKLDLVIGKITHPVLRVALRALLYAVTFTPTVYHHPPNTIVAPFHLPTICGNLFYGYDYTASMFTYGVLVPVAVGWLAVASFLTLRLRVH